MKSRLWPVALGLATLTLWGCGSDSSQSSLGPQAATLLSQASVKTLAEDQFGLIYLTRHATEVPVSILAADSAQVLYSGRTSPSGTFVLPQGLLLPPAFRISATTPEGVTVERYVEGPIPYLFVNCYSHLVSLYKQKHPEMPLSEVEQKVMRGLSLSPATGVYGLANGDLTAFSHRKFLQQAALTGGFEAFCAQIVSDIESGQLRSFASPGPDPVLAKGLGAEVGEFLLHETASGIFDFVAENAAGKITSYAGLHIGTYGALEAIQDQLNAIQQSIDELNAEVQQLAIGQVVIQEQAALNAVLVKLRALNTSLQGAAGQAASDYSSDKNATDHGPVPIDPTYLNLVSSLSGFQAQTSADSITQALTSAAVNSNLLSLCAVNTTQTYSSEKHSSAYNYLELRYNKDIPNLQKQVRIYGGWTLLCMAVFSEIANIENLPGANKSPVNALNSAQQQIIQLASMLHKAQQAVPAPAGSDLVMVDAKNKLMWYLTTDLVKYDAAQNGMIDLQFGNWGYGPNVTKPTKVGSSVSKDLVEFRRPSNMTGWRVPEVSELKTLYTRVQAAGGGAGHDTIATYDALQKLGFTELVKSSDNYKKIWINGAVQTISGKDYYRFYYFNMSKGEEDYDSHEDTSLLHPDADPKYTCIYVRSLPDENFGDNSDQIYKAYGIQPTATRLNIVDTSTAEVGSRRLNLVSFNPSTNLTGDLGDRTVWSLQSSDGVTLPESVAYLNYQDTSAQLIFRGPGSVNVTAAFSNAQNVAGSPASTVTQTFSNSVKPRLKSMAITPQNLALTNAPGGQSLRFFCSGSLASDELVDLTALVEWKLFTSTLQPVDPSLAYFNVNVPGNLIFVTSALPDSSFLVNATYSAGSAPSASWTDAGQGFTVQSRFVVPAPAPP